MKKTIILTMLVLSGVAFAGFEGVYDVEGSEYFAELTMTLNPAGYYSLEWNYGTPGDVYFAAGIEAFGLLAVAELDEDFAGVYKRQDSELSGLFFSLVTLDEADYHPELTEGATILETSNADIAGTWEITGEDDLGEMPFSYTFEIESLGDLWKVTREYDTGTVDEGIGVVIGDVLVAGLIGGNVKSVCLLKIEGEEFYGDWMDYWYGEEEMVETGILEGSRL